MVRNTKHLAVFALLIIAAVSCKQPTYNEYGTLEIQIGATLKLSTKADGTSFTENDCIGLTVVKWDGNTENDLTGIRNENNVPYLYTNDAFNPLNSPAYFPDKSSFCNFYAYYPYNGNGFDTDKSTLEICSETDQSDSQNYHQSDWMVASKSRISPSSGTIMLDFERIMSKMTINLIAGKNCSVEDLKKSSILIKSLYTEGKYDMNTKALLDIRTKSDIKPYGNTSEGQDRINGHESIIIPQNFRKDVSLIYITMLDKTLAYKPQEELVFEAGKNNIFNITVDILNNRPSISVNTEIKDWKDGGTITGDANEESPILGNVSDSEGNIYPYVLINNLYWTAKNMMATKYNDGTEIPYHESGNDEWLNLKTPAMCYFENNESNKDRLGALYNYHAVSAGNICPEGWRLPTKDELSALIQEKDGIAEIDALTLMSPEWNNGTNETGFSAMPSGMATSHWYMTDCYLWSSTIADTSEPDKYGYLYLGTYPWTGYNNPDVGMSIRCVKEVE